MGYSLRPGKYSCRICEERYPGCHDRCEKYQSELKAWKEEQEKVQAAKNKERDYDRFHKASMKRMMGK